MPINTSDGQFALGCYLSESDNGEPVCLYSNVRRELEDGAERLVAAGKYKHIELFRWDFNSEDWILIREF